MWVVLLFDIFVGKNALKEKSTTSTNFLNSFPNASKRDMRLQKLFLIRQIITI